MMDRCTGATRTGCMCVHRLMDACDDAYVLVHVRMHDVFMSVTHMKCCVRNQINIHIVRCSVIILHEPETTLGGAVVVLGKYSPVRGFLPAAMPAAGAEYRGVLGVLGEKSPSGDIGGGCRREEVYRG